MDVRQARVVTAHVIRCPQDAKKSVTTRKLPFPKNTWKLGYRRGPKGTL